MTPPSLGLISKHALLVSLLAILYASTIGLDPLHQTGQVESTRKNGFGCICHGSGIASDSVHVWIEGSDSVPLGASQDYLLKMTGGPAVAGGFNIAVARGELEIVDAGEQIISSELTHTAPKFFDNDTVSWEFRYIAPLQPGPDTIFSVGNSVDLNLDPNGDQFNFGQDFVVEVHTDTTTAVREGPAPETFRLDQNYPNPFNPTTRISFHLKTVARIRLVVFDLAGREVAVLVESLAYPGIHSINWNADGLAAGIYICRFETENGSIVRKMALIK